MKGWRVWKIEDLASLFAETILSKSYDPLLFDIYLESYHVAIWEANMHGEIKDKHTEFGGYVYLERDIWLWLSTLPKLSENIRISSYREQVRDFDLEKETIEEIRLEDTRLEIHLTEDWAIEVNSIKKAKGRPKKSERGRLIAQQWGFNV